jgi:hypothetical protein
MTKPPEGMPPPIDDETLSAWVDGELSDAERAAVTAAIARDPALQLRARELRATVTLLHALPQPVPRRTFVLTPEDAASVRPVRTLGITRLFPAFTALSAVAAVLCLALFLGDLRTNGFATTKPAAVGSGRAVPEDVVTDTVPRPAAAPTGAPTSVAGITAAATTVAGSAASGAANQAPAAAVAPAVSAARAPTGIASPPVAPVLATAPSTLAASATAPPVLPTVAAAVSTTAAKAGTGPFGGATTQAPTERRVPLALIRIGEVVLLLLFLAGAVFAYLAWRARRPTT